MSYRIAIEILPPDMGDAETIADRRRLQCLAVSERSYEIVARFNLMDDARKFVHAIQRVISGQNVIFIRDLAENLESERSISQASELVAPRVLPFDKHFVGARWMVSRWGTLIRECPGMTADQVQTVVDVLNEIEAKVKTGGARNPNHLPQTVL